KDRLGIYEQSCKNCKCQLRGPREIKIMKKLFKHNAGDYLSEKYQWPHSSDGPKVPVFLALKALGQVSNSLKILLTNETLTSSLSDLRISHGSVFLGHSATPGTYAQLSRFKAIADPHLSNGQPSGPV